MKHLFRFLIICCLLFGATATLYAVNGTFGGGTGSPGDPFMIEDAADLDAVRNDLSASYELANDIDLTVYLSNGNPGYNGGAGWSPIGDNTTPFTGDFNGAGYKITGLWIDRNSTNIGVFGYIDEATIDNVSVEITAAGVKGYNHVGGLAGQSVNSAITNCHVTGNVSGSDYVGGLLGIGNESINNSSFVINCYATGNVAGGENAGGLIGGIYGGNIINSHAAGDVSGTDVVGGLVGRLAFGSSINDIGISNCYATGNVTGSYSVGGLAGYQGGAISTYNQNIVNSYATGDVSGTENVGGLAGGQENSTSCIISHCYAAGSVTGDDYIGGLLGRKYGSGSVSNCFFDAQTTGQTNGTGGDPAATGVTGLPTADMQTLVTFTGATWDFTTVWGLYLKNNDGNIPGYGYPYLRSFNNDILIIPTGGSQPYNGLSASTPVAYTVNGHYDDVNHPLTGNLACSGSDPAFTDAGDYAIVRNTLTNPHYQISFKNDEVYRITPAPITVTSNGGSSVYGDTPANPGISVAGLVNDEPESVITGLYNSFGIAATTPAGVYTLRVTGTLTNSNYTVSSTINGTWEVVKRPITVKADDMTIAEGAAPALTCAVTSGNLVNGDVLSGALAVEDDDFSFGVHTIIQGTLTAGDNYDVTFIEGELTVVIITDIKVDGQSAQRSDNTTFYAVAGCGKTEALVAVTADPALTVEINGERGNSRTVALDYGDNIIYVTVTANGNTQTNTLFILRPYDQVEYEYDDVPTVNCNTQTNGGYDFTDFQWYRNDEAFVDAAKPYCRINDDATYYCRITLSDGRKWRTCDIQLTVIPTKSLKAYPNPTHGLVTIDHEQLSTGKVQVFDMYGKLVLLPVTNPFDMSALPNGMYVIKVNGETVKIVKK